MLRFVLKRLAVSVVTLFLISILLFLLIRNAPGDPIEMYYDPITFTGPDREEMIAMARARLGLDQPLVVQYFVWLGDALTGNLGRSLADGRAVATVLGERLQNSLALIIPALLLQVVIGLLSGVWSALRRNKPVDYVISFASLLWLCVPPFFAGLIAIYVFGLKLRWLPTSGMNAPDPTVFEGLRHLILPALLLGMQGAAVYQRYTRSSMLDVLGQDFITTARSKGLSNLRITWRHAVHNALIPIIAVIAVNVPTMFGGAVIIEQIFAWPGLGRLAVDSITGRDYPMLMGFVMFIAILVVIANLVADLLYAVIDPRIRV
ncbi:ABC transporter permease [Enemella evansiae]|uniref:ABC transporter permease n=1 Tax=Enemella evansiae TaxID=2016499 RepID=UPI000B96153A|nr:ABC transporter permease [Enemella evansiae]OYO05713.1 peptide permease [Enemella evansiae]OYO15103.1 peptide permease [Enemella evansiae]OYO20174.1 peptide permease [Enemella evansiae]TDO92642.1 peptide/nickel transport system permease protein [Enemella evansiae]